MPPQDFVIRFRGARPPADRLSPIEIAVMTEDGLGVDY